MIAKFIKFVLILTAAHFIVTCLFIFVALIWWGHGGGGAPSPFIERIFVGALKLWTLGDLPYFLSSPIFGIALSLGLVILTRKQDETKSV
jgi:hypothetical protein